MSEGHPGGKTPELTWTSSARSNNSPLPCHPPRWFHPECRNPGVSCDVPVDLARPVGDPERSPGGQQDRGAMLPLPQVCRPMCRQRLRLSPSAARHSGQLHMDFSPASSVYLFVYVSGTVHINKLYTANIPESAKRLVFICSPCPDVKLAA